MDRATCDEFNVRDCPKLSVNLMLYRQIFKSFIYWSGRFSPNGSEQPFNALLMVAACQTLLLVAFALFYEFATSSILPLGSLSLTFLSLFLFLVNLCYLKYANLDESPDISNTKIKFLAPLFSLFCIFMLIFSVVCLLSQKNG